MEGFEEDPAAAFLAREQDDLAGIADDTLGIPATDNTTVPVQEPQSTDFFGGGGEEPLEADESTSDPYAAVTQMDTIQADPECIKSEEMEQSCDNYLFTVNTTVKQWRQEQAEMLSNKDLEEEESLEEMCKQAAAELQEWHNRHEEQLTQTKGLNRQAESAFIEERDEDIPGHEWERVARICDFNPKNSKNTKDMARMRSIFLQLKQTPLVRD